MSLPLTAVGGAPAGQTARGPDAAGPVGHFADRLIDLVREADRAQKHAEAQATQLAAGEGDTVETMVSLAKADLSLRLVTQLRNRVLEAYQEVMRLQV